MACIVKRTERESRATASRAPASMTCRTHNAPAKLCKFLMAASASNVSVGQKVKIVGKEGTGTVRFVGETDFKPGTWVGVEMDDPVGRHDGTVEGRSYFQCAPQHGTMVQADKVRAVVSSRRPREASAGGRRALCLTNYMS